MNYLVMKVEKSKLIQPLIKYNTMCVFITEGKYFDFLVDGCVFTTYKSFEMMSNDWNMLDNMRNYDNVIIWSNESKSESEEFVQRILKTLDEEKTFIMFGRE